MGKVIEEAHFDAIDEQGEKYRIIVYRDSTDEEGYGVVFGSEETDRTIAFGHGMLARYMAIELYNAIVHELEAIEGNRSPIAGQDFKFERLGSPYIQSSGGYDFKELDAILLYLHNQHMENEMM